MVDTVVVLVDGRISEIGSYEELLSHEGAFAQFLNSYFTEEVKDEDEEEELENDPEGQRSIRCFLSKKRIHI
jgi:hypothetical protein